LSRLIALAGLASSSATSLVANNENKENSSYRGFNDDATKQVRFIDKEKPEANSKDGADTNRKAWVGILTADSFNHTEMLATQIQSIENFSKYKQHITLVLPAVSGDTIARLSKLSTSVVAVERIESSFPIESVFWQDVFSKLHIFNMTSYEQVAFLDSDAFIESAQADQIFEECRAAFFGVRDALDPEFGDGIGFSMVNAGVLVVRPSTERFNFITNKALPQALSYSLPEQGFSPSSLK
jgi:hypothetical protein